MAKRAEDPVLISARREAIIVFATWGIATTYCLIYCGRYAYGRSIDDLKYVCRLSRLGFLGHRRPVGRVHPVLVGLRGRLDAR